MELIVDLHTHSHYARATSPDLNLESTYLWCKLKGINVIGTGDFTHPLWFKEIQQKLIPAEDGLFMLNHKSTAEMDTLLPASCKGNLVRFILTTETSNIYYRHERSRRLHNLIIAPSFDVVSDINKQLSKFGKLESDGRPILMLDSADLLQLALKSHPDNLFIPAHIWTPWFGLFGSKSGFDSLAEAFGDLVPEIKAIETGLSSDPPMNVQVKDLQNVAITSHSDAHSAKKLAREATILNCELSYKSITTAIKKNDDGLVGTIEFYPQEGKYYYDGHRAHNISMSPQESDRLKGICPVCGKKLVIGVLNRTLQLSHNTKHVKFNKRVEYIIPLLDIISVLKRVKNINAKSVQTEYEKVITELGSEFNILRKVSINDIKSAGFAELAHEINNMRQGAVEIEPGYDGVYGKVKIADKRIPSAQKKMEL